MSGNLPDTDRKNGIYTCDSCCYSTAYKNDFAKHSLTKKHKRRVMEMSGSLRILPETITQNENEEFYCVRCSYRTMLKGDFIKHENSDKHRGIVTGKAAVQEQKSNNCEKCGRMFSTNSGLWKHIKKCSVDDTPKKDGMIVEIVSEMFKEFVKSNKDMQMLMVEQNNKIIDMVKSTSAANHSNNSNSFNTNNQFNLQFFLNETCKDAINLTDFINSLNLQVKDFETTGKLGYVEGITRIIINGLRQIDVNKRPLHCTDVKRETVYIREENSWEKENGDKKMLRKAVNNIARKNLVQLKKWQEINPEFININSSKNDEFLHLSSVALGGQTQEEEDKFIHQILKNVLKEVVVDKK